MSATCLICGYNNNIDSIFCENCGAPLIEEKPKDQPIPSIDIGYATCKNAEKEKKDRIMILDVTSLFNQENHRRIQIIMIKNSEGIADDQIMNVLITNLLQTQKTDEDIKVHLTHTYEQLIKNRHDAPQNDTEQKLETGLLTSIIDNKQLFFAITGTPRVVTLNNGGIKNRLEETKTNQNPQSCIMEPGDFACLSSNDIFSLIGEKEASAIILKAENPQTACDHLLASSIEKKNGESFSIIMIQFLPKAG